MPLTDLQRDARGCRLDAEARLADRLAAVTELDRDRRCARPADNLVPTVTAARWAPIAQQLGGGNGGELAPGGGHRPKFCSAFSSSALAVNAFGVFAGPDGAALSLPGAGAFAGPVVFEAQRSAGTRGYKPNLDAVAEPAGGDWLYVESKCLEYLRPHGTAFSAAFVAQAHERLAPATAAAYARFAADDGHDDYALLDAAQLLKHFLAAKLAAAGQRRVTLAYVFWEPEDAAGHAVFAVHRAEAARLAASLADDEVGMVALSYPELWAHWETLGDAALADHVAALRGRYAVTL